MVLRAFIDHLLEILGGQAGAGRPVRNQTPDNAPAFPVLTPSSCTGGSVPPYTQAALILTVLSPLCKSISLVFCLLPSGQKAACRPRTANRCLHSQGSVSLSVFCAPERALLFFNQTSPAFHLFHNFERTFLPSRLTEAVTTSH